MKKQQNLKYVKKLLIVLLVSTVMGCSSEDDSESTLQDVASDENQELLYDLENLTSATNCNETRFPSLGDDALAGNACSDITNPVNIGTLDCRTNVGGYSHQTVTLANGSRRTYGVYSLTGSSSRYPTTKCRVERSFQPVTRGVNKNIRFTSRIILDDLSNSETNFAQVHSQGKIMDGLRKGEIAASAIFGVQAVKTSNPNLYKVTVSHSVEPFTDQRSGRRTTSFLKNLVKGREYILNVTTGYSSKNKHFSIIKISEANGTGTKSVTLSHTYTAEKATLRYGGYVASDSGDTTAKIRFRNTKLCRVN
ncbi:hypothetical protein [Polaribacter sp. L3A8]|uniref:hypothetical protein n=1 Tax=Polaribacter sp. L3A8 TaxID=2686361 RepID=UPI00131A9620|nr:hypothetical protein [Polaribacter sp. L3A8]